MSFANPTYLISTNRLAVIDAIMDITMMIEKFDHTHSNNEASSASL